MIRRLARPILERLGSRLILRRRLPARFGRLPLCMSPGAALAYFGSLDRANWRELYTLAEHHVPPGATVWDLGANVGVFTFCAAHRAGPSGHVLAIEADPWLSDLLRRSAAAPGARAPVEVLCAAVAGSIELRKFSVTSRTRSGSHLSGASHSSSELVGAISETHPVLTVTLDWLAERRPTPQLLKIDVEGAELQVLQGASSLLERVRPVLMLECQEANADAVTTLLHAHGYRLYEFTGEAACGPLVSRATYNTLAFPPGHA
jgi:FkbM family methyltransferase